ncbi:MAG TPA: 7-cyano-7-deazaguanine synthase QueC, partial [Phototrophicaceae bacterium]|nr:7-cyano-7-deazaguanine synthase QueC [Phototrophicaceae bacterium]
ANIDCVVIVSGGMDSVTLLHYLVKQAKLTPAMITFQYGQKHAREIESAKYNAQLLNIPDHRIVDLTSLTYLFASSALVGENVAIPDIADVQGNPQPPTYVPNRNMIFLALAAAYAESLGVNTVYYGAQAHDLYGYWDTTPDFLRRLNNVYQLNRGTPIHIEAPFVHDSKTQLLRVGLQLGVDYAHTWSCYVGGEVACGHCPTCAERLKAFEEVGIPDPLPYQAT